MQYMKTQGEVQVPSQYSQLIQSKCRSKLSRDFMRLRQENTTMSIVTILVAKEIISIEYKILCL